MVDGYTIVDIVAASPGERRLDELYVQAIQDAEKGRPVASENPIYGSTYDTVARHAEARAGRLIYVVCEAEFCPRCRYLDHWRNHVGCQCGAHPSTRIAGAMVFFGPMADDYEPEFVPWWQLRTLVLTGLRAQDSYGRDITAQLNAIQ